MNYFIKNLFLGILFCVISQNLHAGEADKIVGAWASSFPVADVFNGYIFTNNGVMYYTDHSAVNISNLYSGAKGLWRIEKNKLFIKIEYDLVWESKWIINNLGEIEPGLENKIKPIKRTESKWMFIGDLRLFTSSKYYEEGNKSKSKPDNIFLLPIINKEIMESTGSYWRICKFDDMKFISFCATPRNIIDAYDKIISRFNQ